MRVVSAGVSPRTLKEVKEGHKHAQWEIILNIEGSGEGCIGEEQFSFKEGTVCCVPPNTKHPKKSEGGFKDIYFSVDRLNFEPRECIVIEDDEEKTIENLIYMIIRTYHKKEHNYAAVLDSLAEAACNLIVSRMKTDKDRNPDVEHFINELIVNYTNCSFTVGEAMANTNYNKDHFRRVFKQYTGVTPVEYLTNLRVRCAKNMLKNNNGRKIKEIAFESGFSDYLYFAKVFKKHTGLTPGEYAEEKSK